jgi:hypothetical protein
LIVLSPVAQGGTLGFKEWQKHEHPVRFELPRIHEPVPSHVPQLTNDEVLRLFHENRNMLMFRTNQIELQLGEALIAQRNIDPTQWDHRHPGLAKLVHNPELLQYAVWLYNTHQARFTHYHHPLIPVMRGWAMMMHTKKHPVPVTVSPPPIREVGSSTTMANPVPQPITIVNIPQAVPAPPSVVLMVVGVGYVVRRWRRARLPL